MPVRFPTAVYRTGFLGTQWDSNLRTRLRRESTRSLLPAETRRGRIAGRTGGAERPERPPRWPDAALQIVRCLSWHGAQTLRQRDQTVRVVPVPRVWCLEVARL